MLNTSKYVVGSVYRSVSKFGAWGYGGTSQNTTRLRVYRSVSKFGAWGYGGTSQNTTRLRVYTTSLL